MTQLFGTPTIGASGDGRLELFVIGVDSALHHIYQTRWSNGWSTWSTAGGPFSNLMYPPAVGSSGDGRLEVFVAAGGLQHMWQTRWSNGWSGWVSHGTPDILERSTIVPPDLALDASGRLQLFTTDGALWRLEQTAWSNGWSAWISHGTPPGVAITGPPCVARNADGRL